MLDIAFTIQGRFRSKLINLQGLFQALYLFTVLALNIEFLWLLCTLAKFPPPAKGRGAKSFAG